MGLGQLLSTLLSLFQNGITGFTAAESDYLFRFLCLIHW